MRKGFTTVAIRVEDKEVIAKFLKARKMSWADLFRKLSPTLKDMMGFVEYTTLELQVRL